MTILCIISFMMSHLLIWGNAYAQIIRDGAGRVLGLYPLLPDKMDVQRDERGNIYYVYSRNSDENPMFAEEGTVSFGTPVPMPGAVSISMDPTGEPESFYADGIEYYVINNNQRYDGDLELAMIPESFRTEILKEETDDNKVLVENANSETGSFALLFEFDGDIRKIRHVLYNCSASRPTIESKTNEEDKEVQTETLTIKARPMADGYVKAKTGDSTTDTFYDE